jgi:hypothetical protein
MVCPVTVLILYIAVLVIRSSLPMLGAKIIVA